jgi:pre-rRNA-processing protein TSR3
LLISNLKKIKLRIFFLPISFYKKMFIFLPTIILRHQRENLKKCTLRGLETRPDCLFFTYPKRELPDLSRYFLLTLDAPCLSKADSEWGIFLIDGTWRYTERMQRQLPKPHHFQRRSLPPEFQTAYPRRQQDCPEPSRGLASIEALFLAYLLLGRNTDGLLENFHWREEFLKKNITFL